MQHKIKDANFSTCYKCKQDIPWGILMIRPHRNFV